MALSRRANLKKENIRARMLIEGASGRVQLRPLEVLPIRRNLIECRGTNKFGLERATRFELATASLEGWSSTPELRPPL